MLAQAPQAVERAEPLKHGPQGWRHAGAVCVLVEPLHHGELHEGQGQGLAAVHLQQEGQRPAVLEAANQTPLQLALLGVRASGNWRLGSMLRC